ncbi:MAG: SDR family NAD(P)-dependent oxidoreductase [Sphingobacteriaceae bacterium]|jgi:3-oxoacyl-[acyl-carrier protein] reductase
MLVIITGASKGIGFELMQKFANSSYMVIAISRNVKTIQAFIQKNNIVNVLPLQADISKKVGRDKILKTFKQINKPVSIVVNNAGEILVKSFAKISEKELISVYQTNVFAPYLLIQSLLPWMGKKASTHVVNISSMGGFQGSAKFAGLSAYSSSKAALAGLTECLAEELKGTNITVNCLAIGAVQTEMLSKAFPGYKAPLKANEMASYIHEFAVNGNKFFNGKILPVSSTTP